MRNAIENYKSYLMIEKGLTKNSISAYITDIEGFAEFCATQQVVNPADVTVDHIKNFFQQSGVTERSQARRISSLRSFFKYLVYDGQLDNNPTTLLEIPRFTRKLPNILTNEEVSLMLNAVELFKPEGYRNKAIIEMLYSCGLRVSEIINVKLSNINFKTKYIKVEGENNKNRLIPLEKNTEQAIRLYLKMYRDYIDIKEEDKDILFLSKRGTVLSRVIVFIIIKHLANRAGIKKNVSPHTFRHSFANNLSKNGTTLTDIQKLLGHESILTTEIYSQLK